MRAPSSTEQRRRATALSTFAIDPESRTSRVLPAAAARSEVSLAKRALGTKPKNNLGSSVMLYVNAGSALAADAAHRPMLAVCRGRARSLRRRRSEIAAVNDLVQEVVDAVGLDVGDAPHPGHVEVRREHAQHSVHVASQLPELHQMRTRDLGRRRVGGRTAGGGAADLCRRRRR
jgi:hypothetical protein